MSGHFRSSRVAVFFVLGVVVASCGGNSTSPTAATPPAPPISTLPPEPAPPAPPPTPSPTPVPPPPRVSRTRYLAFGDSLTAGTTSSALANSTMGAGISQSYPYKLQDLLQTRYAAQTIAVENAGVPGEGAEDAVLRFPGVLRATRAEVVILMHGVNDITVFGQSRVVRTANYVNTMARDARIAGARVFLCTLPPQRAGGPRATEPSVLASFNRAIRDIARGEAAVLVDLATDFGDLSLIGADGLHPTEAGYARIAQLTFDAIRAELEAR